MATSSVKSSVKSSIAANHGNVRDEEGRELYIRIIIMHSDGMQCNASDAIQCRRHENLHVIMCARLHNLRRKADATIRHG